MERRGLAVLAVVGLAAGSSLVTVEWAGPVLASGNMIPTYLDQVNPGTMARTARTHPAVFSNIRQLAADRVRYLHWDPFALSYPLPRPPAGGVTSWDFSGIDPYVEDFMEASAGHDALINFAPLYTWASNSTGVIDRSGRAAGEYFSRIISWYTSRGFVDEFGVNRSSNYSYVWKYWEVLNEVDAGSSGTKCVSLNNSLAAGDCVRRYTELYDGIVTVLHRDHPQLEFTGLVLAFPDCAGAEQWFSHFLNADNHRSPVRESLGTYLHEISFHFYAANPYLEKLSPDWLPQSWRTIGQNPAAIFVQAAQFVAAAGRIRRIVDRQAPGTRIYVNEIGILAPDPAAFIRPFGADRWWWNLQAAHFAYVYGSLAALGVDAMAASQLTGYPGNAAAISMLDWSTGQGTAWFWVVKMFIDTFGTGLKDVVEARVDGQASNQTVRAQYPANWTCIHAPLVAKQTAEALVDPLYAQAFVRDGSRLVLLANTRNSAINVTIAGADAGSWVRAVDSQAGFGDRPYSQAAVAPGGLLSLGAFGVAIVRI